MKEWIGNKIAKEAQEPTKYFDNAPMTKDIKAVVGVILKWAKEQEAIDKFGEITLVEHEQGDLTAIATAIVNHFEAQHKKEIEALGEQNMAMIDTVLSIHDKELKEQHKKEIEELNKTIDELDYKIEDLQKIANYWEDKNIQHKKDLQGVLDVYEKYKDRSRDVIYNPDAIHNMWQAIKKLCGGGE